MRPVSATIPWNIDFARVNPGRHPDWAGDMNPSDCVRARGFFNGRIAYYDPKKRMIFWSRKWTIIPDGDQFELPFGANVPMKRLPNPMRLPALITRESETCTLLVRMAKDFGTDVLPIGEDYVDFSDRAPWALIKWEEITMVLQGLLNEIDRHHSPVWTVGASNGWDVVVMFIPTRSKISRRWAMDMRATGRRLGDVVAERNRTVVAVA
ncbi:MAG: hypothetical protein Q9182_007245 [Xanthomendoza sp. 2 TL-2023]